MAPERLAFSLQLLAESGNAVRALAGSDCGHLVIAGGSHWQPDTFSVDLKTLTCVLVEPCDGAPRHET